MGEAALLCDRVAFLHKGEIQLLDQPKALRQQFSDSSVSVELKDGREVMLKGGPESAKEVYNYMVANEVVSIHSNEPTLGDIFVEVTRSEEHTSELQSRSHLVCRLMLVKKQNSM